MRCWNWSVTRMTTSAAPPSRSSTRPRTSARSTSLIDATKDTDWWVSERAVDALADIGSKRALPRLLEMLQTTPPRSLPVVVRAIGKLGDAQARWNCCCRCCRARRRKSASRPCRRWRASATTQRAEHVRLQLQAQAQSQTRPLPGLPGPALKELALRMSGEAHGRPPSAARYSGSQPLRQAPQPRALVNRRGRCPWKKPNSSPCCARSSRATPHQARHRHPARTAT